MTLTKIDKDYSLYDTLAAKKRELATQAEDDGRILRAVSDAAVAGEDVEEIERASFDRQELSVICAGLDDALRRLAQRICDTTAESRGVNAPTLQALTRDAKSLRLHIANVIDNAVHTAEAVERKKQERTAYTKAFDEFSTIRGELLRAGRAPLRASEEAKERMECDPADLWPTGSFGPPPLGPAGSTTPPNDPTDAEENRRARQVDMRVAPV